MNAVIERHKRAIAAARRFVKHGFSGTPAIIVALAAEVERREAELGDFGVALKNLVNLYDTDDGCRSLPQYREARGLLAKGEAK